MESYMYLEHSSAWRAQRAAAVSACMRCTHSRHLSTELGVRVREEGPAAMAAPAVPAAATEEVRKVEVEKSPGPLPLFPVAGCRDEGIVLR